MLVRLIILLSIAPVPACTVHGDWNEPGTGEAGETGGPDGVARGARSIVSANALSANALSANALSANALSANALSANALSANALSANGLLDSGAGVSFTHYLIRCALAAGESITVEISGVKHRFDGLLGLSPEWKHTAPHRSSQEWVSACLLAHVNAFGFSVPISLRGRGGHAANVLGASPDEAKQFPVYEASFFGNLFDGNGSMYACWGSDPDQALARSWDRGLRVCSDPIDEAGVTECGFIGLGMCSDVCQSVHGDSGAWTHCSAPDEEGRYVASLGVWLRPEAD